VKIEKFETILATFEIFKIIFHSKFVATLKVLIAAIKRFSGTISPNTLDKPDSSASHLAPILFSMDHNRVRISD
jgi:hypothetical protein